MRDYCVEISEEWNAYDSSWDVTKAYVTKNGVFNAKKVGVGYKAYPTYYPWYLRNLDC